MQNSASFDKIDLDLIKVLPSVLTERAVASACAQVRRLKSPVKAVEALLKVVA
jgi:hypothetical protein